jgi:hypothetical protein
MSSNGTTPTSATRVSRFIPMRSSMAEFGERRVAFVRRPRRYPMQTIEAHPHAPVVGE